MLSEIKGNNPGNIRWSANNNWQGQTGKDYRGFVTFSSLFYGTRAMLKLLYNYITQGNDTIAEIIYKWAPPIENNTVAYINFVSNETGIDPNEILSSESDIKNLFDAMILIESNDSVPQNILSQAYDVVFDNGSFEPGNYATTGTGILLPLAVGIGIFTLLKT